MKIKLEASVDEIRAIGDEIRMERKEREGRSDRIIAMASNMLMEGPIAKYLERLINDMPPGRQPTSTPPVSDVFE